MRGWILFILILPMCIAAPFVTFNQGVNFEYNFDEFDCVNCIAEQGVLANELFAWIFLGDHDHTLTRSDVLELNISNLDHFYYYSKSLADTVQINLADKKIIPLASKLIIFEENDQYYAFSLENSFLYGNTIIESGELLNINNGETSIALLDWFSEFDYYQGEMLFFLGDLDFDTISLAYKYDLTPVIVDAQPFEIFPIDYQQKQDDYVSKLILYKNMNDLNQLTINQEETFNTFLEEVEEARNRLDLDCRINIPFALTQVSNEELESHLLSCLDNYLIYFDFISTPEFNFENKLAYDVDKGVFYLSDEENFQANRPFELDEFKIVDTELIYVVTGDINYLSNNDFIEISTDGQVLVYQDYENSPIFVVGSGERLKYYKNLDTFVVEKDDNYVYQQSGIVTEFSSTDTDSQILNSLGLSGSNLKFDQDNLAFTPVDGDNVKGVESNFMSPVVSSGDSFEKKKPDKELKTVGDLLGDFIDETAFDDPITVDVDKLDDLKDVGSDVKTIVGTVEQKSYEYFGKFIDKIPFGDRTTKFYIFAFLVIVVVVKILRK